MPGTWPGIPVFLWFIPNNHIYCLLADTAPIRPTGSLRRRRLKPMPEIGELLALFASAFLSATLLPGSSEAALVALLAIGNSHPAILVLVATAGNVLGSVVNWMMGRFFAHFRDRRWFPVDRRSYERAVVWYGRMGVWSLLFAWVPIIGDPLTVVAGALRVDIRTFLILVTLGKAGRYIFITLAFTGWSSA